MEVDCALKLFKASKEETEHVLNCLQKILSKYNFSQSDINDTILCEEVRKMIEKYFYNLYMNQISKIKVEDIVNCINNHLKTFSEQPINKICLDLQLFFSKELEIIKKCRELYGDDFDSKANYEALVKERKKFRIEAENGIIEKRNQKLTPVEENLEKIKNQNFKPYYFRSYLDELHDKEEFFLNCFETIDSIAEHGESDYEIVKRQVELGESNSLMLLKLLLNL